MKSSFQGSLMPSASKAHLSPPGCLPNFLLATPNSSLPTLGVG